MNALRKYLDIISESTLFENPWEGKDPAKAAAWAKLSPQVQQKLGGADPTDEIIVGRMVKGGLFSGKPVTDANPDGTAKTPAPAPAATPAPAAAPTGDGDGMLAPAATPTPTANAVAASGQPDDATGVDAAVAAQAASGQPDDATGVDAAVAAQAAQPAQSGQPVNRDSMTFGQAFADARKNKESTFTWKGKQYGTQLAPSKPTAPAQGITNAPGTKGPSGMPAQQGGADPMTTSPEYKQLLATLNATFQSGGAESPAYKQAFANFNAFVNKNKPTSESVGYAEDQNLVSIVHLAGLR